MSNTNRFVALGLSLAMAGLVNCGGRSPGGGTGGVKAGAGGGGKGGAPGTGGKGGAPGVGGAKGGTSGSGGAGGATGGSGGGGTGPGGGSGGVGGVGGGGAVSPKVIPPYPGAVIYMKFDETAGTTAKDETANANNGTLMQGNLDPSPVNPAPKWSAGRTGAADDKAWESNGVDEWIRIPRTDSIDNIGVNNAITISIWLYVNAITILKPYNVIVQRHILGTRGEHIMLGILNGIPYAGQNHMGTTGPVDVPLAQWVHMALTFDMLTLTLYVNGEDVARLDTGTPIAPDDTPLSIGAGINEADMIEWVNARFDEFQFYDKALTALEVAHLAGK